jgi:hypothetical protein
MEVVTMDTDDVEVKVDSDEVTGAVAAAAHRATEVVADVAASAGSAVKTHGPTVLDASRDAAGTAYGQVQQASDQQLLLSTTFLVGLISGLVLARVPRVLVLLLLVPLTVVSGTLLSRRFSMDGGAAPDDTPVRRSRATRKS